MTNTISKTEVTESTDLTKVELSRESNLIFRVIDEKGNYVNDLTFFWDGKGKDKKYYYHSTTGYSNGESYYKTYPSKLIEKLEKYNRDFCLNHTFKAVVIDRMELYSTLNKNLLEEIVVTNYNIIKQ